MIKPLTNLIDFRSLKLFLKSLKSLEIILISMKSNDFEISYVIFASVGPLDQDIKIYWPVTCIVCHAAHNESLCTYI